MAKTRREKEEIVAELTDKFRKMKSASFTSISGYTMEHANVLREKATEQGGEVFVAKKTLILHAAKEAGLEGVDSDSLKGSILTAVGYEDEVSSAKLMKEFAKELDTATLVAGVLEGKWLSKEEIEQLASLPSKEELYARLVGSINAPVSGFVNVLAGNIRNLSNVLNAIKDQKTA